MGTPMPRARASPDFQKSEPIVISGRKRSGRERRSMDLEAMGFGVMGEEKEDAGADEFAIRQKRQLRRQSAGLDEFEDDDRGFGDDGDDRGGRGGRGGRGSFGG